MEQRALRENLGAVGDVVLLGEAGFLGVGFGEEADFFQRSGQRDGEVVGHQVGVVEDELDG
ncbi:MAG: hypothetical protein ACEQSX_16320, partial [Baekduiaceae bacterium]